MAEGASMNQSPRACDRWRFEGEVYIGALRSGALNGEGSDLRLKSDLQHEVADHSYGELSSPTRLELETEGSHALSLFFCRSSAASGRLASCVD